MFLKNLTLKGFKSFADKSSLDFEPGVTVIVGPNGSGKSNVVDAIAWVLGAQAPSAVRSHKMDDVIFAGTQSRPALGRAEVSLTIDNRAKVLPIEFEEVTLTRTLFRSGDSEYSMNGVACRLLDIQELLSDSGVGRQQHVIVSQGQIDAVLNARPEDRRAIIEEAAGVLKHRRRKEKAVRRLNSTEANMTRIGDLVREVRRQLKPLERQADAARRHGGLVAELVQLRVHLLGREVAGLREQLRQLAGERGDLRERDRLIRAQLSELDAAVLTAEASLSAAGADDLGELLTRSESLRERTRGVQAVLIERLRAVERERNHQIEGAVTASLEADAGRLTLELGELDERTETLRGETAGVERAEADVRDRAARFEEQWGDGGLEQNDEMAQVRGDLAARRHALEQAMSERSGLVARREELGSKSTGLEIEADRLRNSLLGAEGDERRLLTRLDAAAERVLEAMERAAEASDLLSEAESNRRRWTERADALTMALEEVRARSGVAELSTLGGVIGTLLELVEIDEGWEAAFVAAAGDATEAVVVSDSAVARDAVNALRQSGGSGAILRSGPRAANRTPILGGESLRGRVRGVDERIEGILDQLLAEVRVVTNVDEAIDAALARPDAVIVTRDGDRFGPTGWRIGGDRIGATGVALEEAVAQAERGIAEARRCDERSVAARSACAEAEGELQRVEKALEAADDAMVATSDGIALIQRDLRDLAVEAAALDDRVAELDERIERDATTASSLEGRLTALDAEDAERIEQLGLMDAQREEIAGLRASAQAMRADLSARSASLADQRRFLTERLEEVETRLFSHAAVGAETAATRARLDALQRCLVVLQDRASVHAGRLDAELDILRAERRRQSEQVQEVAARLDHLRRERADQEAELSEIRARLGRVDIAEAEVKVRLEAATDVLRRELDTEAGAAMDTECPALAAGTTPPQRVRELERELKIMGPINPLALEEYEELKERYEFFQSQIDDIKASRRELYKVIRAIDTEIVNVFAAAFADVALNFERLFQTLFPGGVGRLRLTDPNDVLETGLEIDARPSGKNIRKLSLLSGGERSLTALAFLFAVFRSRPSPFYVMDEVEAALDDVNLHRFLDLVAEFRDDAQLIIVSHQKRTMEAADCLFGVSMKPGQSSRVISERVGGDRFEALV